MPEAKEPHMNVNLHLVCFRNSAAVWRDLRRRRTACRSWAAARRPTRCAAISAPSATAACSRPSATAAWVTRNAEHLLPWKDEDGTVPIPKAGLNRTSVHSIIYSEISWSDITLPTARHRRSGIMEPPAWLPKYSKSHFNSTYMYF